MLFHHAHVVDGEQGHLHGDEGFHLLTGGANGLLGCGTKYGRSARLAYPSGFKFNSDSSQRQKVTHRDEVAGVLGALDAGDTGNAQHVAFFGGAGFDEGQGGGQHSIRQLALAMRFVAALVATSTMWAWPWAIKMVKYGHAVKHC